MSRPIERRKYGTRTFPAAVSARSLAGAVVGLVAVLFNVLGVLVMPPVRLDARAPAIDPALAQTARALGQSIVLCTPSGIITIGPDGVPVGTPGEGPHSGLCAFCLPMLSGGCASPANGTAIAFAVQVVDIGQQPPRLQWVVSRKRTRLIQPRAPPAA